MATKSECNQDPPVTPTLLALGDALGPDGKRLDLFEVGDLSIELRAGSDALWAVIRRSGKGGLAMRAATIAGDMRTERLDAEPGETAWRSEEHTSELQTIMRIPSAVFCLKTKHN